MKKTSDLTRRERFARLFDADFRQRTQVKKSTKPNRVLFTPVYDILYSLASVLLSVLLIGFLLFTVGHSPTYGDPKSPAMNEVPKRYVEKGLQETGASNAVAGMILDYRAFDTFGEALMLFCSAMAVIAVLKGSSPKKQEVSHEDSP